MPDGLRSVLMSWADCMERYDRVMSSAASFFAMLRQHGKLVVASGYFNPLHIGHIAYLKAAKLLGDYLVVIVNNNAQVVLKGSLPFMPEAERLAIVREMRCVDCAFPSIDEDRSVCRTLEVIRPHIFANGGDVRAASDCREAATCARLGIEMVFGVGGADKIQSSSALLKQVSQGAL